MTRRKKTSQTKLQQPPAGKSAAARSQLNQQSLLVIAAIALVTTLAYLPALDGGFIWDDDGHVTKPELQSLAGLGRIWFEIGATQQYYPLLHSAFWFEHELWGDSVLGYHLVNLVLHIGAASLVYAVLRRLAVPGAWLAAAIFALHPVQVESVAWITEQKNTLSAVFYLAAMWWYLDFDESRRKSSYFLSMALFVLGLMTKTVTATLPAAALVIFWWQRGRISWKHDVLPLIPFFVLGAAGGLVTAWVERELIGAEGADFQLSLVQRCLLAGRIVVFYVKQLVWPANLIFIYPHWDIDPTAAWQWLFPLVVLALTAALVAIHGRWRTPLAGWLFFVGTLFPVLGFLNVYPFIFSFVADHFQYLASLGIFTLAAAAAQLAIGRLSVESRWIGYGIAGALLACLAALTWQQAHIYRDAKTLYASTIERNPECWMAYNNLGAIYAKEGNWQGALECYQRSLQYRPKYAEAEFNLGAYYMHANQMDEAMKHFQSAIEMRPGYADAQNNLGAALYTIGRTQEAMKHYQLVVEGDPGHADAHNNLGIALLATGRAPEAAYQFQQAVELRPTYAEAYNGLARAYVALGRPDSAISNFQTAVELKPDYVSAHKGLALALAAAGRTEVAIDHFEIVAASKQSTVDDALTAYQNLATAFQKLNQPASAVAAAQRALEIARAAGRDEMARQIEAWLGQNRGAQPAGGNASPVPSPPPNVP